MLNVPNTCASFFCQSAVIFHSRNPALSSASAYLNGDGHIINISSVLGFIPSPYSAHYAATKHALEGYSESLDHETRTFGVRISLIEPAITRSAFEQSAMKADSQLKEYDEAKTNIHAIIQQAVAVGDQPEVVAETVVLAATVQSPKRRYPAGKTARQISMLRRIVPANMFDKSLRKQLNLSC
jgi:short-subunit dehydrogenase